MRIKKKIWILVVCMALIIMLLPVNASASVKTDHIVFAGQSEPVRMIKNGALKKDKYIRKTAKAADVFAEEVLGQTQFRVMDLYGTPAVSRKKFISQLKKIYGGKLKGRQKSMIAASQASGYTVYRMNPPEIVSSVSAKKVKKKYKELFGTAKPKIDLPAASSNTDFSNHYLGYVKEKSKVYSVRYEKENSCSTQITGVKKAGSHQYTITEKCRLYTVWYKEGTAPVQNITVRIKVKKKPSSPYGYHIIGVSFQ